MANFRRKKPRHRTSQHHSSKYYKSCGLNGYAWLCNWPKWWDVVYHTRPARRRSKELVSKIARGTVDADNATFDPWHKPHKYYW